MNEDLRARIVELCYQGQDGHIPSAFSIIDILAVLYRDHLRFDARHPHWSGRDYFILSKGHGCLALYAVLEQHGILDPEQMAGFCTADGILGEHPDLTKVPGAEASTGSLGHGLPFALGIALGLRLKGMDNRVYVLCGDGECNEGTIWESALVAANLELGNLCLIVDLNSSSDQILPVRPLPAKLAAFGWDVDEIDGHSEIELQTALSSLGFDPVGRPKAIVANTVKGKGVRLLEGHGKWHHRIPDETEYAQIMEELTCTLAR